jgi:hypothetical protein
MYILLVLVCLAVSAISMLICRLALLPWLAVHTTASIARVAERLALPLLIVSTAGLTFRRPGRVRGHFCGYAEGLACRM